MAFAQRVYEVTESTYPNICDVGASVSVYDVLVAQPAANGRKDVFRVLPMAVKGELWVADPRQLLTDEALHRVAGGRDCEQLALVGQ
jgi:hypothetical protein